MVYSVAGVLLVFRGRGCVLVYIVHVSCAAVGPVARVGIRILECGG